MSSFKEKRLSRVGERFTYLTITGWDSRKKGYSVVCDCGKESVVKYQNLTGAVVRSCGSCFRNGRPVLPGNLGALNAVWNRYRLSAKKRSIEFTIEREVFHSLIKESCSYCGHPPSASMNLNSHPNFRFTGVDRVDNNLGYVEGNCVPCCSLCNMSKHAQDLEVWLEWIRRVYLMQVEKGNISPETHEETLIGAVSALLPTNDTGENIA